MRFRERKLYTFYYGREKKYNLRTRDDRLFFGRCAQYVYAKKISV